ncbi:hypothetical protein [Parasitella parasitica]|uniref:Cas12f1-like TNB domain-containing protein n=1 Tax=Parasitella parasitica TaxID=35722 RepID=A0A0B7NGD1_9FUNG|nr:hypothetical protein [Parasitella parasitica]
MHEFWQERDPNTLSLQELLAAPSSDVDANSNSNYYILLHCKEDIPEFLILYVPVDKQQTHYKLQTYWSYIRRQHPTIVYSVNLDSGNSHCVTEACVQVATTYSNAIVETFEKRVMSYLYYLIQNICMSMKPDQVKLVVKEYCYQYVFRGEPKWPTSIDPSNKGKLKIRDSCNTLRNLSNESISLKSLSAFLGNYVRWFSYILSIYKEDHRAHSPFDVRQLPLPRRFSITPIPSCRCKFVTVSASALSSFIKGTRPTGYEGQLELLYRVFNFTKLRFRDTKEYYDLTGSTKYTIKLQNLKNEAGITPIKTDIPTAKTCLAAVYHTYAAYMLLHRQALLDFYGFQRAKVRFYLYQGRQKAPQIMVNMLVNGGKKYNRRQRSKKKKRAKQKKRLKKQNRVIPPTTAKPAKFHQYTNKVPLIVFGSGMFGKDSVKLKGNKTGVTDILWRAIKKREKEGDLLAITIDEFKTSRICYRCYEDSLKKVDNVKGVSVLGCENCKTLWQRDVNAAKNMLLISSYIWNDHDRPFMFRRRTTTA